MKSNFEEIYRFAKTGDDASKASLKELCKQGVNIDEGETASSLLTAAGKLAKEGDFKAVTLLHSLGASEANIAYGFGLGYVHCNHWPGCISLNKINAQWAAGGAANAGHTSYAEELRIRFKLDATLIAEFAISGGYPEYANELYRNHHGDINKIMTAAISRERFLAHAVTIGKEKELKALRDLFTHNQQFLAHAVTIGKEKELKALRDLSTHNKELRHLVPQNRGSQPTPPSPAIIKSPALPQVSVAVPAAPRSNTTPLQTTGGLFTVKLEELIGKSSPAMIQEAYNQLVNPYNPRKIPVPATINAPFDSILTKFMRFKSDDILYTFFQSELISQLTHHEQALLKQCRFVLRGTKKEDGSISSVYSYNHDQGVRGKPEVELTLTQVYTLFNFLIYFHIRTVENNDLPEGTLSALNLLAHLSDTNHEISSLHVEFIPPQKALSIFEVFSLLNKVACLNFIRTACLKEDGTLPYLTHLSHSHREQLSKLRFSNFFNLMQQSIGKCHERFDAAQHVILKDIPVYPLKPLPVNDKAQLTDSINETLQALKIDAVLVADKISLPENPQQKLLLLCLIPQIEIGLSINNKNEIAAKGQKPVYDKATGTGNIIEDHSLFYLRLKYSGQSVGDLLDSPEIQLLTDNLAYQPTNDGSLAIYSETSPYKIIGKCAQSPVNAPKEVPCSDALLVVLDSILRNALSKRKLMLEREQQKNSYRQQYQHLSNQELLSLYNHKGGVFFIRKLRLTEDSDGTNPFNAFLRRYNGEHILPAALIRKGLIAATYPGIWQSCAGLVVMRGDDQEQLAVAYKRPANSNSLKGIHISKEKIGSALQSIGGKPYSSIDQFVEKLQSNQEKAVFTIEDKDSFDYIKSFITFCINHNKKELVTGPLSQKTWNEIHSTFKEFLTDYLLWMYRVPAQEAPSHKIYQQILEKFQKKFLNRNAPSFASHYKDIVREKPGKGKYGNQSRFYSEALLKINMQKRSLDLGDSELDVLRELLIERCGEAVAAFVQLSVASSITDALTIGEGLKAYHGEGYVPIYAVLDERNLLDASGMDTAVEKTGCLTFKTEEELFTILTQAETSRDLDTIRKEIKARVTLPEQQAAARAPQAFSAAPLPAVSAPQGGVAAPMSAVRTPQAIVAPPAATSAVTSSAPSSTRTITSPSSVITKLAKPSLSPVVFSGDVNLGTLLKEDLDTLQAMRGDVKRILIGKFPEYLIINNQMTVDLKLEVILQKWPAAEIYFDLRVKINFITIMHTLPRFLEHLQKYKRKIVLQFPSKPQINFELKNLSLLSSSERILIQANEFSSNYKVFHEILAALPTNVHCEMPPDFIQGCVGIDFSMVTFYVQSGSPGSYLKNVPHLISNCKAKIIYLHSEDFLSLPIDVFSSRKQQHFLLNGAFAQDRIVDFILRLPTQHNVAALYLGTGFSSSLKGLIAALDKMLIKPTVVVYLMSYDLKDFCELTELEIEAFKRLVHERVIVFHDVKNILGNNYKQIAESKAQFLVPLLINASSLNSGNNPSYQDVVKGFELRQQAVQTTAQVNNSQIGFFQQPAATATPVVTSSTPSTTVTMTEAPSVSSSRKRAKEDEADSSKPDVTSAQRKRMG